MARTKAPHTTDPNAALEYHMSRLTVISTTYRHPAYNHTDYRGEDECWCMAPRPVSYRGHSWGMRDLLAHLSPQYDERPTDYRWSRSHCGTYGCVRPSHAHTYDPGTECPNGHPRTAAHQYRHGQCRACLKASHDKWEVVPADNPDFPESRRS